MISSYLPTPDLEHAPVIVKRLREVFDHILESLYAKAVLMQAGERDHATKMMHVPFAVEHFDVEAMYDMEQDLFTQLVARPAHAADKERPPYTISIFLSRQNAEERV